jgi:hypothetical protein
MLRQNCLLAACFDVFLHLHNKSIGKGKVHHCMRKQI